MIDTEALRKKVIDLAIQGKLTKQLPEDGNAEDLYVQIQEEKAKLVKEGKIKKDKTLTEISDDEIPFEIPNNWRWVRIGDATYNHGQKTPDKRFCYIDVGTLDNVNHKLNDNENIIEAKDAPSRAKKIVKYDDVLYSTVRPYLHNICIVDKVFSCEPIASTAFAVMHTFDNCLLSRFLYYWLLSEWFDKYANGDSSKGTLYPAIGEKDFFMGLVPLAPFEEQKRIVEKLEDILAQIDIVEALQQQYESDCEILKGKIIDAGIRGMLTEQLPEDGDAEELFAQIQGEKAKLIEEGKLRKTRGFKNITEDEQPYFFPNSWKICYIDDVAFVTKLAGFEYTKYIADSICEQGIPLFKGKNIQKGELVLEFESYIPTEVSDELPRSQVNKKCLLTPYVGTIGNIALFDGAFKAHLGSNVGKIEILNPDNVCLMEEFLLIYLRSDIGYSELNKHRKATAQDSISIDAIRNVIIAIPPIEEQKRISNIINELLSLITE